MNLCLADPAFLARAVASGSTPADTLLAEMKYTGYNVGQLVNNGTSIDGFTTWADYGFRHSAVASPYGTAGKAARFPTSGENGGSGNSRYAIHLRVPRTLRGGRDRIQWKVCFKTPATGNVSGQSGDGYTYLFWWGTLSLRTSGGTGAVSTLCIFTGSTLRAEMAYAYAADTHSSFLSPHSSPRPPTATDGTSATTPASTASPAPPQPTPTPPASRSWGR